jgi:ankyrin repeat protein
MLSDSQRLLLGKPLDPNLRNKHGETLLIAAVKVGSKDVVSTLMKLGADPSFKGSDGKGAIEQATEMKRADLVSEMKKHK